MWCLTAFSTFTFLVTILVLILVLRILRCIDRASYVERHLIAVLVP